MDKLEEETGGIGGQLVGDIKGTTGKCGGAICFNGKDSYADLNHHKDSCLNNLNICPHGITVAIWVKFGPKTSDREMYVLSSGQTWRSQGISIFKTSGEK